MTIVRQGHFTRPAASFRRRAGASASGLFATAILAIAIAIGAATASAGPRTERPAAGVGGQALDAAPAGSRQARSGGSAPETLAAPSGAEVNHNVNAEPGSQAESAIALEPDNPDRLIAAIGPSSGNPKAWLSNDAMKPGSQVERELSSTSRLPTAEGGGTSSLALCCQPALTADSDGNLWYAVTTTGTSSHIVINRVAAGGTSFQSENVAIPRGSADLQ